MRLNKAIESCIVISFEGLLLGLGLLALRNNVLLILFAGFFWFHSVSGYSKYPYNKQCLKNVSNKLEILFKEPKNKG